MAGVDAVNVYHDLASGVRDDRPGLDNCRRTLRKDDVLVVWKLDRLGRNLAHLVNTVQDLSDPRGGPAGARRRRGADRHHDRGRPPRVRHLRGAGPEFERELIRERTAAGLEAARARGRKGGRKFALSKGPRCGWPRPRWRTANTSVAELCRELDSVPEGLVLACDRWLRLGRALKTEFVLQYMSEPQLRAKVRRGLLKVEQLHALARAVYYGQRGRSAPEWCSVP